jgi:hypothetical protein
MTNDTPSPMSREVFDVAQSIWDATIGQRPSLPPSAPPATAGDDEMENAATSDFISAVENAVPRVLAENFTLNDCERLHRAANWIAMCIDRLNPEAGSKSYGDIPCALSELKGFKWHSFEMRMIHEETGATRASVWLNGVWHTWDEDGTGGENSSSDSIHQSLRDAEAAVVRQGWHENIKDRSEELESALERCTGLEKERDGANAARDRFCHAINEVGRLVFGDSKDCYAPEAVVRKIADALDAANKRCGELEKENQKFADAVVKSAADADAAEKSRNTTIAKVESERERVRQLSSQLTAANARVAELRGALHDLSERAETAKDILRKRPGNEGRWNMLDTTAARAALQLTEQK